MRSLWRRPTANAGPAAVDPGDLRLRSLQHQLAMLPLTLGVFRVEADNGAPTAFALADPDLLGLQATGSGAHGRVRRTHQRKGKVLAFLNLEKMSGCLSVEGAPETRPLNRVEQTDRSRAYKAR